MTESRLALPTPAQRAWSEAEIGIIIHLDIQVFDPNYGDPAQHWGTPPPAAARFNPKQLDTDQWVETAARAGARYAVLTAKHSTGFSLWPTEAHDYSVKNSPWRGGQGDIVGDFIASCRKFGIQPGLYCSASSNAYLNVNHPGRVRDGDPEKQRRYDQVVMTQLTELWTRYGPLFEIWFDGGLVPADQGGPPVVELLRRLQPDALIFGGNRDFPNLIRDTGYEHGRAEGYNWSTTYAMERDAKRVYDRFFVPGVPDGPLWAPTECVMPNRDAFGAFLYGWFYRPNEEKYVFPPYELLERYYDSVGRNGNLLLGMAIDDRGLVPDVDRAAFLRFGELVRGVREAPRHSASGTGDTLELTLPPGETISELRLMEDTTQGERVRAFVVEAWRDGAYRPLVEGEGIGHRRLYRFAPIKTERLRLRVTQAAATPAIRAFEAYYRPPVFHRPTLIHDARGRLRMDAGYDCGIAYTLDGTAPTPASPRYREPVPAPEPGRVRALALPTPEQERAYPDVGERASELRFGYPTGGWSVVSADSEFDLRNRKENVLAPDNSLWISAPGRPYPHELVLDLGSPRTVRGFLFTPSDHCPMGPVTRARFYTGDRADAVDTLVAEADFGDTQADPAQREVPATRTTTARYVRLELLATCGSLEYAVVQGVGVI